VVFRVVHILRHTVPIGACAAMAYTIGATALRTFGNFALLMVTL